MPLLIVFITERMYHSNMYQQSLEDIPDMQEIKKLNTFFTTVAWVGNPRILYFFYIISINLMPKPAALYIWCSTASVSYLTECLKSMYGEDRPYWVSDNIKSSQCEVTFGNPSGLMLNNVFFWITVYLHAYYEVGVRYPRMSVFCTAYIIKMAVTCLGISLLIFMGFSRGYMGVGAYNEVIFGTLLGATLAFIGHYVVKPKFLNMPETLYSAGDGSQYAVTCLSYFKAVFAGLLIPLFFALLILLGITERAFHHAHEYRVRQSRAGCSSE